jgi:hypothetical protein
VTTPVGGRHDRQRDRSSARTTAGIVPVDADALAAFLAAHEDAPAYRLHVEGGPSSLLWDVTLLPAGAGSGSEPTLRCTPLSPAEDRFRCSVGAVASLHVVRPPSEAFTAGADSPAAEARGLARLASVDPRAVSVSSLLALLDRRDTAPQRSALRALRLVAAARPADCTPAVRVLHTLLDDGCWAPTDALAVLHAVGTEDPARLVPLLDVLRASLDDDHGASRRLAARCVALVADDHPGAALDAVPALAALLSGEGTESPPVADGDAAAPAPSVGEEVSGRDAAVAALCHVAREYPDEVAPALDDLVAAVRDDRRSTRTRLFASVAVGQVVASVPARGRPHVAALVELLEDEAFHLRNNAVAVLSEVTREHPADLVAHVDRVAALATDADDRTRVNASCVLARVAAVAPRAVGPHVPTVRALLADEVATVRANACWALAHLRAADALPALRRLVRRDDDGDVRRVARRAVARVETP